MISRSFKSVFKQKSLINSQARYAGGAKKPNMPAAENDFDVIFVGGLNATALLKFAQQDLGDKKMAIISDKNKFLIPQAYFGCMHEHLAKLDLITDSMSSQVDAWSRVDQNQSVVKYMPDENKVELSNGRVYTYKALVLSPGLDHRTDMIEGLEELNQLPESENFFLHKLDQPTVEKNFQSGWNHNHGEMVCYSPKAPYKGEGSDFYALYYESYLRQDIALARSSPSAKIQYWTPNKEIFKFPYANEVVLEECWKRGIEVNLGWEMTKVHINEIGEKIATFKNVDTGDVIEQPMNHANINPTSVPHANLVEAGITDSTGMVDVNPYTLQHERFDNIFAWGDCIAGETTRTQHAAVAQCPVVKHNLYQFLEGKTCNAVYDGYTYMNLFLSHSNMTNFSHLYNFEPCATNHSVPNFGAFSWLYFMHQLSADHKAAKKYSGFTKNHGPGAFRGMTNKRWDPIEKNEYLLRSNVDIEAIVARQTHVKALPGATGSDVATV